MENDGGLFALGLGGLEHDSENDELSNSTSKQSYQTPLPIGFKPNRRNFSVSLVNIVYTHKPRCTSG